MNSVGAIDDCCLSACSRDPLNWCGNSRVADRTRADLTFAEANPTTKSFALRNGGLIMGATIWSMHFVAMMAVEFPLVVSYNLGEDDRLDMHSDHRHRYWPLRRQLTENRRSEHPHGRAAYGP